MQSIVSPCATCKGKPNYCTSCVAGFTRMGWKCRNNTGTQFRLVFSALPSTILADIDNIACGIIAALNAYNVTNASCDQSQVTFTDIVAGSTAVSGTSSSGSSSNLASGTGSLGYTVTSSSVTTYGTETSEESSSNVGLIVGLVVGIIALSKNVVIQLWLLW